MPRLLAIVLAIALLAVAGRPSLAQAPAPLVAEQQAVIDGLGRRADEIASRVQANSEDDARLVELRLQLEQLATDLLQASVKFRPRLAELNARLEQIGPPPAEGAPPEAEIVATERQQMTAEKAEINALIGRAESTSIRVNQLIDTIATMRRDLFANTLSKRYELDFALGGEVFEEFGSETADLYRTFATWLRFVINFKLGSLLAATFMALAAAAVLLIGGRRLFGRLIVPDPLQEEPSYLSRLSVAFWSTLLPALSLLGFFAVSMFFLDYFNILRSDIRAILASAFVNMAIVFFIHRLGRAALSPELPNWRLVEIGTQPARRLVWLISATALVTGLDYFLSAVSETLGSPLSLTVANSLVATVLVGILVILISRVRPFLDENGVPKRWPTWFRTLLAALGLLTIAAALLGYIGLARFVSQQIVVTGAILATMYIGFLSASAVGEEGAFAQTALGRRMSRRYAPEATTLDQVGLAASIVVYALIVVGGLPLILFLWGFQWGDIQGWAYRLATGIRVGSINISILGILTGLLVFVAGYFLTRGFQRWLDGTVMARGRVDVGVRNSIRTAVGYAGLAVAALVGISAAGIDLSDFALVAGALSLGIGFGLQNVVSNFVSGLILLAERPFKAGDWIVAGTVSGTVRKISVRATEIETFQRQTVILPNSELINAAVGNWTHKNKLGRVDIKVQVAYESDAVRAHALMTEIAKAHPLTLRNPEPFVLFANFGPSALEFEIRIFLADVLASNQVHNDIRFAVLAAFEREGIVIPSTPRAQPPTPPADPLPEAEPPPATRPAETAARPKRRRRPDPD